jgi:hypothetical protein
MPADDGGRQRETLGLLDADFTVSEPPELVEQLQKLADRYHRVCTTAATCAPSPGGASRRDRSDPLPSSGT